MKRRLTLACALFACAALQAQPFGADTALRADGLGKLKMGMSLAQVNRLLDRKIIPTPIRLRAMARCDYQALAQAPGVALVFIDQRLARIDVSRADIADERGIRIGDALAEVSAKLPASHQEPLAYVDVGTTLIQEPAGQRYALSFQFENHTLTRMIAGDKQVIRYAEGCD